MWWFISLSLILYLFYTLFFKPFYYWSKKNTPHVKPWPIFGNTATVLLWKKPVHLLVEDLYNKFPNSCYMGFHLFHTPTLLIRDNNLLKQISSQGFDYLQCRRIGDVFFSTIKKCIEKCSADLIKYYETKECDTVTVEMQDVFGKFVSDVVAVIHDTKMGDENYLQRKRTTLLTWILDMFTVFGYGETSAMKFLNTKIFSEQASLFLTFYKYLLKHEGTVKSPNTLREHITAKTLFFDRAGVETICTIMCFAAHELAVNTDIQKRLQHEIDLVSLQSEELTCDLILNIEYLDMVIKEVLRKWPPFGFAEKVSKTSLTVYPEEIDEEKLCIEKGTVLWIPIYGMHRDPKYYMNPTEFDPERFSNNNSINIKQFAYLPFGLESENCVGGEFATVIAKILIFYILHNFDLVVVKRTQLPLKLGNNKITLNAQKGFWLGLKKRTT